MTDFNLSAWALRNRPLVGFFVIVLTILGVSSYLNLSQSEDPPFTFKAMVVRTMWPGATAEQVERQLTDKIEEKLQETPQLDFLRSYSKPGESMVFILVKDSTLSRDIPDIWYEVRKKVSDIRHTLPDGVVGPFVNDEFGETYGNLYALVGEGFDPPRMKEQADRVRAELLRVPEVAKVQLFGVQDERIYIEVSNHKLATLGIDPRQLIETLQQQNAIEASGFFEGDSERIYLRPSGDFDSVDSIAGITIRGADRLFRLGDIARVWRGTVDPPAPQVRVGGQDAIVIGVVMATGGDVLRLGDRLTRVVGELQNELPLGLDLVQVADQPAAVRRGVREFVQVLAEAVGIVLLVSFFSLGLRTGMVVALSIPLVLAMTFFFMDLFGIGLHKISLGALVLALGLLVDDAIIAVEMMAVKLEQGWDRLRAASFAYTSTAFPMLTGTIVTVAGFLPIATANSATGEYTRSIFQVTTIALLVSWVAAVILVPYLGYRLLPDGKADADHAARERAVYDTPFYRRLRSTVRACVERRWQVLGATLLAFLAAGYSFGFVQQQFFPSSTRLELLVDLKLADGASLAATRDSVRRMEKLLDGAEEIVSYSAYVGSGAPRFYLPLDQQLSQANFAQMVINTHSIEDRERLRTRLIAAFESDFSELRGRVLRLENGPPVGYPLQFRVSGPDHAGVRKWAAEVASVMRANPYAENVHLDWDESSKVIRVDIDQDKARLVGLSTLDLRLFINNSLNGTHITDYREGQDKIAVVLRGPSDERATLSQIRNLAVPSPAGAPVTLSQLAKIEYAFEPGTIFRRNRLPTITVRADIYADVQAPAVSAQILPELESIRAQLPVGYRLETGGAIEDAQRGQQSIVAGLPLLILVVLTTLMIQLRSFSRVALVVLTAPLGIIGVALFLLVLRVPFGFVAMLGTIALSGMIMRNSVILVDQIDQDIASGLAPADAIVEATVRRFRPILLTAMAAILAMVPLSRSVFFGPMAVSIMGGLLIATALTILFLPALYAAWFRVPAHDPEAPNPKLGAPVSG